MENITQINPKTIVSEDYSVGLPHMTVMYVVSTESAMNLFEDENAPEFMFNTQLEAMTFSQVCLKDPEQALDAFGLEFDIQVLESIDQFNIFECLIFFDDFGNIADIDDNYTTAVGSVYLQTKDNSIAA